MILILLKRSGMLLGLARRVQCCSHYSIFDWFAVYLFQHVAYLCCSNFSVGQSFNRLSITIMLFV